MVALLTFGFLSCDQEELNLEIESAQGDEFILPVNLRTSKIDICHYSSDDDQWFLLSVNPNAWDDHSLHGDVWLDQDGDGYTAFNECEIGSMDDCDDLDPNINPEAEEVCGNGIDDDCDGLTDEDCVKIFAIAYSNLNGVPGFQENSADVLISKLIDSNGDNVISFGDKVITNRFPLNCDASEFGDFGVKEHTVQNATEISPNGIKVRIADFKRISYNHSPGSSQGYWEYEFFCSPCDFYNEEDNITAYTSFNKFIEDGALIYSTVVLDPSIISQPLQDIAAFKCDGPDANIFDVDIFID